MKLPSVSLLESSLFFISDPEETIVFIEFLKSPNKYINIPADIAFWITNATIHYFYIFYCFWLNSGAILGWRGYCKGNIEMKKLTKISSYRTDLIG